MKSASAGMATHIDQGVTTLTTLFRVTRTDGTVLGFTDHDRDITFNGLTHEASSGYIRSALQTSAGLSVDDVEVRALLDSPRITQSDIRDGLYDNAEFEMSLVNWDDLSQGDIKLRKGTMGRYRLEDGTYVVELRGLTHRLERVIGDLTTARCRADVFDIDNPVVARRCGLDASTVDPNATPSPHAFRGDNRVATVTDRRTFTVAGTVAAGGATAMDPTNGDAESGGDNPPASWTAVSGRVDTVGATYTIAPNGGVLQFQFDPLGAGGTHRIEQTIDLVGAGLPAGTIDAGLHNLILKVWSAQRSPAHVGATTHVMRFGLRVLNASNVILEERTTEVPGFFDATYRQHSHDLPLSQEGVPLRVGARFAVVILEQTTGDGAAGDFLIDDVTLSAQDVGHDALATNVDYYTGGILEWVSGANRTKAMEVKSYVSGTGTIELFLPMRRDITVDDRLLIYPGCNKTLAACRDKFNNVRRFKGEPHLPGRDRLLFSPDAQ